MDRMLISDIVLDVHREVRKYQGLSVRVYLSEEARLGLTFKYKDCTMRKSWPFEGIPWLEKNYAEVIKKLVEDAEALIARNDD